MNIFNNLKYDYYSFDIFDTLLYRTKEELELFKIVEEKLIEIDKKYKGFAELRLKNQKKAQAGNKVEATIYDIYDLFDNYSSDEKKVALEKEIETEKENLKPNLLLIQLINNLRKHNKKILIISDMYFDGKIISDLLSYFSIDYDNLFVSSDYQLRKSNGKLFKYVIKRLNINKRKIVHIGDNKKSDYLMPKFCGIKSYKWKLIDYNHTKVLKNIKNKKYDELYEFINKKNKPSFYFEIGYNYFGPVLYSFCNWINCMISKEKLEQICFLSRDGQIVSKAYKIIYNEDYPYFLASRRTLTVPLLENVSSMKELLDVVPYIKRHETIDSFFKKVGIDDEKFKNSIKKKYGENIDREFLISTDGNLFFNEIKPYIIRNAIEEKNAAKLYIQNNLLKGKIGLVDIGWYGTMQKSIDKICKSFNMNYDFFGLYFGYLKRDNNNDELNASGFIYNYKNKNNIYDSEYIYGFNGLIELIFTADHPSAKKYIINNNEANCILEQDVGEYSDFVKEVQKGALEFIKDYKNSDLNQNLDNYAYLPLEDLLSNPKLEECYLLGELKFYDAYFEKIIQFDGWKKLIMNPKSGIKKFLNSNWKIGYIKEMFKISKPKIIYKILNKIK